MVIGLIKERKIPSDSRVALTPAQCKLLINNFPEIKIIVEPSNHRCFSDKEYENAGITLSANLDDCNYLFGIKEVPAQDLIADKAYLFFSHTKKMQAYNQTMFKEILRKNITLIDYECLEHDDGIRIIGFGFFAGVVGAHNGMMAYGNRTGAYNLGRVFEVNNYNKLIHTYFGLKIPNIKIAVTGSGKVAHGVLEIMNLMGIHEVEPEDYLSKSFKYPVYVQLKGADLYLPKSGGNYARTEFHENPEKYICVFKKYLPQTDILMNGIYWNENIPRLFDFADISKNDFRIVTIADITDDVNGSVPCNICDSTIENPIYGIDKKTFEKTEPYLQNSVDLMSVGNLPNELPRDASRYFGEQLIKYVVKDLLEGKKNEMIKSATIVENGVITERFLYLKQYGNL